MLETILEEPAVLVGLIFKVGLVMGSGMLALFTWIILRKIRLLNLTLRTKLAGPLVVVGWLFFLVSIVTLALSLQLLLRLEV